MVSGDHWGDPSAEADLRACQWRIPPDESRTVGAWIAIGIGAQAEGRPGTVRALARRRPLRQPWAKATDLENDVHRGPKTTLIGARELFQSGLP